MLILLDNLDSFTYNLVSMFQHWGEEIFVFRNQALSAEEIVSMNPEGIVLSPGPGRPAEAGIMPQLIRMALRRRIPLLGVCLGHQGIAEAFGAEIVPAKRVMHGKISRITLTDSGIFAGMPNPFPAVRYHSLAVREESLPAELEITARSEDGEIMGLRDRSGLAEGVQFHPESVLTEHGMRLIAGFCAKLRNVQNRDVR